MKIFSIIPLFLIVIQLHSQKVNFSNKDEFVEFLNKKEFMVGQYGTLTFDYDGYEKDFRGLKFKVSFTPSSSGKKSKKILFQTMILEYDGFYIPNFFRDISLNNPGLYVNNSYGENGL